MSPAVLAGRYQLEEVLARGGTTEVWRATDLVLHRPVRGLPERRGPR